MPPHSTGQEGISKLCGALNRSWGQYRVGERWVVEPERSREAVGETRFALHPGSTQRVTPQAAHCVNDEPSRVLHLQHVEGLSPLPPSPGHHGH